MAIFRKVHTSFWSDSFVSDLNLEQKLFYIYLLTNEKTKQCGIYEITKKHICFDLGYSMDRVSILLGYFIKTGKIRYNEETKEIAIKNWLKYNNSSSSKVQTCIQKDFDKVKDRVLIEYIYSMDTQSQEEEEQEEEKEKENNIVLLSQNEDGDFLVLEKKEASTEMISVDAQNPKQKPKPKIPLSPLAPPSPLYAECIAAYNSFIIEQTGVPAKIDGQQGKAMKSIIQYLKTASTNKEDEGVLNSFKFILAYKDKWDPFHQRQLTLSQINSNLINILSSIKNPKQNAKSNTIYDQSKYR